MLTTALAILPPVEERSRGTSYDDDSHVSLRDFGPHITTLVRDLVTHVELLKGQVDAMHGMCELARRATFADRQAARDVVRFGFVLPRLLYELGAVLQLLDEINFGCKEPGGREEI